MDALLFCCLTPDPYMPVWVGSPSAIQRTGMSVVAATSAHLTQSVKCGVDLTGLEDALFTSSVQIFPPLFHVLFGWLSSGIQDQRDDLYHTVKTLQKSLVNVLNRSVSYYFPSSFSFSWRDLKLWNSMKFYLAKGNIYLSIFWGPPLCLRVAEYTWREMVFADLRYFGKKNAHAGFC